MIYLFKTHILLVLFNGYQNELSKHLSKLSEETTEKMMDKEMMMEGKMDEGTMMEEGTMMMKEGQMMRDKKKQ